MIKFIEGNLFENSPDVWLVNPVNTVGVAGAGLALAFKKQFPDNFMAYAKACANGTLTVGKCFFYWPDRIINFPTKDHYMNDSTLKFVADGLHDMCKGIKVNKIKEVACPALGCGLGLLHWSDVKPLIEKTYNFHELDTMCDLIVYEPRD